MIMQETLLLVWWVTGLGLECIELQWLLGKSWIFRYD